MAAIRPIDGPKPFEVRFETPSGHQAQVDFARFVTVFEDKPGVTRIIWLFSMVLGHSRHIVARFVLHQDLQTLLRCHMENAPSPTVSKIEVRSTTLQGETASEIAMWVHGSHSKWCMDDNLHT